jgi:hypothetical protein
MSRIRLANGATREVGIMNAGDEEVGQKNILDAGGVVAGESEGGMSTASVVNVGADENAPAVAGPIASIFSPRMRRVTSPEIATSKEVPRRTTRGY